MLYLVTFIDGSQGVFTWETLTAWLGDPYMSTQIVYYEVYEPPECTAGEEKCIGPHLYACLEGKWVIAEFYSSRCWVPPPPPVPTFSELKISSFSKR